MPTFTNRATLTYNGRTTDSNTVTGNYTATLSATKAALVDSYTAGTRLVYIVSLVNSGNTAFSDLTVTDDLGAYEFEESLLYPLTYVEDSIAYYINGTLQADPTTAGGPPLVISGIDIPANGNVMLIYEALVNETAPLGIDGSITNTITVSGGLAEDVTASATVSTTDEPNLTISKALYPDTVVENGSLTYTFVIQNTGNTAATIEDEVVVTDIFDPILTITSVTLDGTPLVEGTDYSYDETSGEFVTNVGAITVPAATYTQQEDGTYSITPGSVTLIVSGTI